MVYNRNGVWYLRKTYRGKRYHERLGTDEKAARRLAKEKVRAMEDGRFEDLVQSRVKRSPVVTWAQILADYPAMSSALQIKRATARNYEVALRTVLDRAGVRLGDSIGDFGTDEVNRFVDCGFQDVTLTSLWRQARAVFGRDAMDQWRGLGYALQGNPLPHLPRGISRRPPKWRCPPESVRRPILDHLGNCQDEGVRIAFILCYGLALRRSEAIACHRDWIESRNGVTGLAITSRPGFRPKGVDGFVPMPAEAEYLAGRSGFLLPGANKTAREKCLRDLNREMRLAGWSGGKAAHELRKWRGAEYFTEMGPGVAQTILRHADIGTTYHYYADLTKEVRPLAMNQTGESDAEKAK